MRIQDISFSFSYFLKGWCHSFIFCATTHSIISWLHPCLPVFLLPATCSDVPEHSFLLSHSPNPLDLNTFDAYFSSLINKWLQRTARWQEWECGSRNGAVGRRGHLWSHKLNMKPRSKRAMKEEWFRKREESKKYKWKINDDTTAALMLSMESVKYEMLQTSTCKNRIDSALNSRWPRIKWPLRFRLP